MTHNGSNFAVPFLPSQSRCKTRWQIIQGELEDLPLSHLGRIFLPRRFLVAAEVGVTDKMAQKLLALVVYTFAGSDSISGHF